MPDSINNSVSARLTLPNDIRYLPLAINFVKENAHIIGFKERSIKDIELAVEEAVSNVIKHAYAANEQAEFSVTCERIPLGLKTVVKDKGQPFDPSTVPKYDADNPQNDMPGSGLGFYLMHQFMDDISFHILGRDGKEVHLVKFLHEAPGEPSFLPGEVTDSKNDRHIPSFAPKSIPFTIRLARPEEAIEISKCAYDAYEYSYGHEHIYYPDRLKELIAGGQILSAVAVSKSDPKTIMAHNALIFDDPKNTIVEMGMAFTKKQYQNQGCSRKLGIFLLKEAIKKGLAGIMLDCTTAHIYSQKAALGAGSRECCILLGIDPQAQSWRNFSSQHQRVSNIISFKKVPLTAIFKPRLKKRTVFVPEHHLHMIKKIYVNLSDNPKIVVPDNSELKFAKKESSINVHTGKSYQQNASIEIISYGQDIVQQVEKTVKRLCLDKFEVIYLLLNLEDPLTASFTKEFEALGFFFAGIIPGAGKSDKLEVQYLNNVLIDYDRIELFSDFAKELLKYIKERDPVLNKLHYIKECF